MTSPVSKHSPIIAGATETVTGELLIDTYLRDVQTMTVSLKSSDALATGDKVMYHNGPSFNEYPTKRYYLRVESDSTPPVPATGLITCPAKSFLVDMETVTIDDGINTPKVFEFDFQNNLSGKAATGLLTCIAKSALVDMETITISDGSAAPTVFELDMQGNGSGKVATGTLTLVAKADLTDGDQITLTDGANPAKTFEFDFAGDGSGVKATGTINCVAKASHVDGEILTIDDGTNVATVFEFDVVGDGVVGGRIAVNIAAATTADDVKTILIAAINSVIGGLTVTASNGGTGIVTLTADAADVTHNVAITDTVANAGFTTVGMSGGLAATVGAVAVNLSAATTVTQVRDAMLAAIVAQHATLTITPTALSTNAISLANDTIGIAGNVAITHTVTAGGFAHTGMSGGAAAVGGQIAINLATAVTATEVRDAILSAIVARHASLAITPVASGTNAIALTNDVVGTAGNVAITDTITDAAFTCTGMSGGVAAVSGNIPVNLVPSTTDAQVRNSL